jgi:predicted permease
MNIFWLTLEAVAALLGIGILGFWVIGRRNIPGVALGLLSSIAIDITLPCLVLGNLITKFDPQTYSDWWRLPLWFIGFQAVALVLSLLTSLITGKQYRGEFSLSLFLQNGIFFPLIIISGMYPGDSGEYLVMLFLFTFLHPTVSFSVYPYFFKQQPSESRLNWKRIINPVLITTIIGIGFGLLNINTYVPDFIVMILTMIGAMAIPLFMLILGGNIYNDYRQNKAQGQGIYWSEIIKFVLIKNFLFPAVFLALLIWLKPDFPLALIIILQAAVPPITAVPLFAERSGGNRAIANQFIIFSFLVSIISIPLVLLVFNHFFPLLP